MTIVKIAQDIGAKVWIATSEDVPGLWVEAGTEEELIDAVEDLLADLLINDDEYKDDYDDEDERSEATYLKVDLGDLYY